MATWKPRITQRQWLSKQRLSRPGAGSPRHAKPWTPGGRALAVILAAVVIAVIIGTAAH
jgi:hypothetical protein